MESGSTLQHRYRLLRPLGRGGMADVYLAFDEKRRAEVALKLLREDLAEDPEFLRRFQREAEALAHLDHPYIVRFYSLERDGPTAFIVMDYVAGTTLRARLAAAGGPLPLAEVTAILSQIGPALQYAHNEGFVHRDIKPGNIMLRQDGTALLSDFGIARATEAVTMTQNPLGTPAYMSPEQILGRHVDGRSDVYSLGIVLYEVLTGRRPFLGESGTGTSSTERVRDEHLHRDPPDPRSLNPSLPRAIAGIVRKAMAKAPAERWQSVGELVAAWVSAGAAPMPMAAHHGAKPTMALHDAPPPVVAPRRTSPAASVAILAAVGGVALILLAVIVVGVAALRGAARRERTPVALATAMSSAVTSTTPATGTTAIASTTHPPATLSMSVTATAASSTATTVPPTTATGSAVGMEVAATDTPDPAATATGTATPVPPTATPTATPTPACAVSADATLAGMWDQAALGCAQAPASTVWSAWQPFQSGYMLWRSQPDTVSLFLGNGSYEEVYEKWDGTTVPPSRGAPPAGLYAPERGFGYLWGTHDYVFAGLGWAADSEKGFCALVQPFDSGYLLRSSTVEYCQDTLFNWARDPSFAPLALRALASGTWQSY